MIHCHFLLTRVGRGEDKERATFGVCTYVVLDHTHSFIVFIIMIFPDSQHRELTSIARFSS